VAQADGEQRGREKEGERTGARFVSGAKETLMVNLAPRYINLTPRQTVLLCSAVSSPLTVHTIHEFPK